LIGLSFNFFHSTNINYQRVLGREKVLELFGCFETMKRNALQVEVMEATRSFKMTAYEQYKVDSDYTIGYDLEDRKNKIMGIWIGLLFRITYVKWVHT
jgi:hypothetical protein